VSLDDCASRGLPRGYGHATVTFTADGRVESVAVDGARRLPVEAVACAVERLGAADVEPFAGSAIHVGTTWFLK
jgi:hypothetical protein